MEPTKAELIIRMCDAAREAYDWLSPWLAEELADAVLALLTEKKAV